MVWRNHGKRTELRETEAMQARTMRWRLGYSVRQLASIFGVSPHLIRRETKTNPWKIAAALEEEQSDG